MWEVKNLSPEESLSDLGSEIGVVSRESTLVAVVSLCNYFQIVSSPATKCRVVSDTTTDNATTQLQIRYS